MGRSELTTIHVFVRGRVQGVGFRWFVRERARELGLCGWVRNLEDGDVEVAALGSAEALERLRARLEAGPPGARVMTVESAADSPDPTIGDSFLILR
jgi:acylphosphatase